MIDVRFDWAPEFSINIESIDAQHKEFFVIGRDIEQLIQNKCIGVTDDQLLSLVGRLKEYISYHFYNEEQLMLEYNYQNMKRHVEEHRKFTKEISKISLPALKSDPMTELKKMRDIVVEITFFHILSFDKPMGEYIVKVQSQFEQKTESPVSEDEFEQKYGPLICELDVTKVYLYKNQEIPGRCILISKSNVQSLEKLSALERSTFFSDLFHMTRVIKEQLKPDCFNYGSFSDIEEHLHYHIVPKYKDRPYFEQCFPLSGDAIEETDRTVMDEILKKLQNAITW